MDKNIKKNIEKTKDKDSKNVVSDVVSNKNETTDYGRYKSKNNNPNENKETVVKQSGEKTADIEENNIQSNEQVKKEEPEVVKRKFTSTGEQPYIDEKTLEELDKSSKVIAVKEAIRKNIEDNPNIPVEEKMNASSRVAELSNEVVNETEKADKSIETISRIVNESKEKSDKIALTTDDIYSLANAIDEDYLFYVDDPKKAEELSRIAAELKGSDKDNITPAIETLSLQEYFPESNIPLQVGTTTTKTYGSGGVYVASGNVLPMSVIDARRRALEKAAQNKAKSVDEVKSLIFADTYALYQDQLDDMSMYVFEKYGELVDYDMSKIKQNQKLYMSLLNDAQKLKTIGARISEGVTIADNIIKQSVGEDGKNITVPKPIMKMAMEIKSGKLDLEDMARNPGKYNKMFRSLRSYDNVATYVSDLAIKVKNDEIPLNMKSMKEMNLTEDEITDLYAKINSGNAQLFVSGVKKFVDEKQLRTLAESAIEQNDFYLPGMDKEKQIEYIEDLLLAHLSESISFKEKVAKSMTINVGGNKNPKESFFERYKQKFDYLKSNIINDVRDGADDKSFRKYYSENGLIPKSLKLGNGEAVVGEVPLSPDRSNNIQIDFNSTRVGFKLPNGKFGSINDYAEMVGDEGLKDYLTSSTSLDGYRIDNAVVAYYAVDKNDKSKYALITNGMKVDTDKYDVVPFAIFNLSGEQKIKKPVYVEDANGNEFIKKEYIVSLDMDGENISASFSDEKTARDYLDKHGGKLEVRDVYVEETVKLPQAQTMFDLSEPNDRQAADGWYKNVNVNFEKMFPQ